MPLNKFKAVFASPIIGIVRESIINNTEEDIAEAITEFCQFLDSIGVDVGELANNFVDKTPNPHDNIVLKRVVGKAVTQFGAELTFFKVLGEVLERRAADVSGDPNG